MSSLGLPPQTLLKVPLCSLWCYPIPVMGLRVFQHLTQWKIHNVFHACLLSPFKETELHGTNETRPPPDLVQGNEEFEVEAILTHRTYKNHETRSLFKWKGYDTSENTWEPESNLSNTEEELNDYKSRHNL